MPATSETLNHYNSGVKTLGILAGGGALPSRLAESCKAQGIDIFFIGFHGQTAPETIEGYEHIWSSLGAAGKIIKTLKNKNITDLVMIGHIRRPAFNEIKPDLKGAEILARIGLKSRGDNDLLMLLRNELEKEGFQLHGVHKFISDLLAPQGVLGQFKPTAKELISITRGIRTAKALGQQDIGQSVIVQNDLVIAVEAIEGTDELMLRAQSYLREGGGAVLVKACKPQQDKDLDLPTIGLNTIMNAHKSGLRGIAIEAQNSLMVDAQELIAFADQHKMFVYGFSPQDYKMDMR